AVIREAAKAGILIDNLTDMILANWTVGKKEKDGYRYYSDLGLSIQGQDANSAWRSIYNITSRAGLKLKVTFVWHDNAKAAFPNLTGCLSVNM
ncbi:MAG: hypothetical protein JWO81_3057, partial [Alphaproteobacteria bacterium]|nr:hypothetical protein [Alphaproteobacteria bacterium]